MSDYSSVDCDRQATAQAGIITCLEILIKRGGWGDSGIRVCQACAAVAKRLIEKAEVERITKELDAYRESSEALAKRAEKIGKQLNTAETEIDRLKLQVKRLSKEAALDPDCSACLAGVCSQHQPLLGQLDVYKRREYRWRKWANKISNYISKAAPDGMLWNDEGGLADQLDDLLCGG